MTLTPDNFIAVMVSGFGILLCLSVGVLLLFRRKGVRQANTFLALLLILYSLTLLNALMAMTGVFSTYQYLYFLPLTFSLSIGPLFYFFVRSRIQASFTFHLRDLIHFVVPAAQFLFYLSIGFRSAEFKSWMWIHVIGPYMQYVEEFLNLLLGIGYMIASIRFINREIPLALWNHPICQWLKKFAVSLLVLLSFSMLYEVIDWILWSSFSYNLFNTPWADFPLKMSYAVISLYIGYQAFIHQNQSIIIPSYFNSDDEIDLDTRLREMVVEKQVYLDPELSLAGLAKMLNIPKNNLSRYFSSRGESFRAYINKYRVDHFLSLIAEGKQQELSLLGLAFDSGFNSKASFNRVFKEMKGKTPSQFIRG